jgi:hypothetical protein
MSARPYFNMEERLPRAHIHLTENRLFQLLTESESGHTRALLGTSNMYSTALMQRTQFSVQPVGLTQTGFGKQIQNGPKVMHQIFHSVHPVASSLQNGLAPRISVGETPVVCQSPAAPPGPSQVRVPHGQVM